MSKEVETYKLNIHDIRKHICLWEEFTAHYDVSKIKFPDDFFAQLTDSSIVYTTGIANYSYDEIYRMEDYHTSFYAIMAIIRLIGKKV